MLLAKAVLRLAANSEAAVILQELTVTVDTTAEENGSAVNAVTPIQAQQSPSPSNGETPFKTCAGNG